ncbi:hypothetical protein Pint_11532 [Pistacia integerrima]|uniref:Uncharacterized protein n=1 Tax=Pistacia integerrima TaxID=434235 RepID=A0ACC0XMP2_9ROSI|nr:hypothetical protein Pint_11532 [Pistacia integerrima]
MRFIFQLSIMNFSLVGDYYWNAVCLSNHDNSFVCLHFMELVNLVGNNFTFDSSNSR